MYYVSEVEGVVRVEPKLFGEKLDEAVLQQLKTDCEGAIIDQLGRVIVIIGVDKVGEGVVIPGDGAAYYKTYFKAIHFIPEMHEIIEGEVREIAKFGAFINFGPFEGMVHISQTMNDIVSVSKQGALLGKESKKALKAGDKVRARIVAISMKDAENMKLGLTMRQPYLGKLEWIEETRKKEAALKSKSSPSSGSKASNDKAKKAKSKK